MSPSEIGAFVVSWLLLGFASYALFHPYVDELKHKIVLNVIAFPCLLAIFLPPLRNEGPMKIAVYCVCFVVLFAISTVLYHFLERLKPRIKKVINAGRQE